MVVGPSGPSGSVNGVQPGDEGRGLGGAAGDGPEGGDPDRSAGLAGGVVDRRGEPGAPVGDGPDGGGDHRGREDAHADAPQQQRREQSAIAGVGMRPGQQVDAERGDQQAGGHGQLGADARGQAAGQGGQHGERQEQRKHGHAGGQGRAVLHGLEVQREHEQHSQGAEVHRAGGGVGGREVGPPEQPQWEHRMLARPLDGHEAGEADDRHRGRGQDRRAHAAAARLDEGEGDRRERARRQRRPGQVEASLLGLVALAHDAGGDQEGDDHDRDVDEDGPPPEGVDEGAAEQRTGGQGQAADPGPDPDRPGLLVGLGEGMADDRERARQQEGSATPLEDPRPDQQPRAGGGPAGEQATPKTASPTRTMCLWPCRSPTVPPASIRLARAIA